MGKNKNTRKLKKKKNTSKGKKTKRKYTRKQKRKYTRTQKGGANRWHYMWDKKERKPRRTVKKK